MDRLAVDVLLRALLLCDVARVSLASHVTNQDVLTRLEILEKKHTDSESEIHRLETLVMKQAATIQELRTEAFTGKTTIAKLTERLNRAEAQLSHDRPETANAGGLDERIAAVYDVGKDDGNKRPVIKKQTYHERQAFTAFSNTVQHPSKGDVIIFNEMLTNEGSGYSTSTGIFTCNQNGLYMFTFYISEVNENNYVWGELMVNGVKQLQAVAETYHLHQDTQGSNLAVLRLKAGDQVWVSTISSNVIPGDDTHRVNTFTGLFLYT